MKARVRLRNPAQHERRGIMRYVRYLMDAPARGFDASTLGDLYDWLKERDKRKTKRKLASTVKSESPEEEKDGKAEN